MGFEEGMGGDGRGVEVGEGVKMCARTHGFLDLPR